MIYHCNLNCTTLCDCSIYLCQSSASVRYSLVPTYIPPPTPTLPPPLPDFTSLDVRRIAHCNVLQVNLEICHNSAAFSLRIFFTINWKHRQLQRTLECSVNEFPHTFIRNLKKIGCRNISFISLQKIQFPKSSVVRWGNRKGDQGGADHWSCEQLVSSTLFLILKIIFDMC